MLKSTNFKTKIRSIWDYGEKQLDRFTVVFDIPEGNKYFECLCLSENGLGFSQWSNCQEGKHLGKLVKWSDLPESLQNHIDYRMREA